MTTYTDAERADAREAIRRAAPVAAAALVADVDPDANPYEVEAREVKASRLVVALEHAGATSADAALMPTLGRLQAAAVARVHAPSDATWHRVVRLLAVREEARAALPADPFAGLPS